MPQLLSVIIVASLAFLVYDIILTFDQEVCHIFSVFMPLRP
jgi:hypothetical protein